MIRDINEHNETAKPNDFELNRLRAALPEYFDDNGNFMIDRLQEILQTGEIDLTRESYELRFLGKSYARYLTSTKTDTVVVPDLEHNARPTNKDSENLYIVGDNLDALKHLLGSYASEVKCIYIDPPYNTGSDGFVYNDDFGFTAPQLVEKIGLSEDESERILDLQGKSSHSAWLTFMYPRLQLAKELLADDGVIFISIDENEFSNLGLLINEIFGEANNVSTFVWQKKRGGGNDSAHVAVEHEYVVMACKYLDCLHPLFTPYDEKYLKRYKEEDEFGRFYWDTFKRKSGKQYYPIECPDGSVLEYDENGSRISWLRSEATFKENLRDGEVRFQQHPDGTWSVHFKQRLPKGKKPRSILVDYGTTSQGAKDVEDLFGVNVFDNPKPVSLIQFLVESVCRRGDRVLDFFSGSGTTAQAVMAASARGLPGLKYMLVQINDPVSANRSEESRNAANRGFETIDEIARSRINKASQKIKAETKADIDYGFKLYRLSEPSGAVLDDLLTFDPSEDGALLTGDYLSKFDLNGTPGHDTVLSTWLVKDGYSLTASARKVDLAGYELDVCGESAYIISPGLTSKDVVELVRMLENGKLEVSRVVVFGYSVTFGVMHELKKNLSVLKSGRTVSVIERL